jgi:hypothetical protein
MNSNGKGDLALLTGKVVFAPGTSKYLASGLSLADATKKLVMQMANIATGTDLNFTMTS